MNGLKQTVPPTRNALPIFRKKHWKYKLDKTITVQYCGEFVKNTDFHSFSVNFFRKKIYKNFFGVCNFTKEVLFYLL